MLSFLHKDIILVPKYKNSDTEALKTELESVRQILLLIEAPENVARAVEIINMNSYKIIRNKKKVIKILRKPIMGSFIFIVNIN